VSSQVLQGDALEVLRTLPAGSVQCCATSPPYYGLRDYGTGEWSGGDPACDHVVPRGNSPLNKDFNARWGFGGGERKQENAREQRYRGRCERCGAVRTDRQLGLEDTPEEYVERLVEIFGEVRRVLRDDGTLWLNLGDSYAASPRGNVAGDFSTSSLTNAKRQDEMQRAGIDKSRLRGVKPKDLLMIPASVALALRQPYYMGTIRDERDRIWLAAMIDAEGCMFIHKRGVGQHNGQGYYRKNATYGAGIEISSTDVSIVENVARITGRGSICSQSPEQNERRKQTIYRWNLRTNECREVIREVYPYLVAKQHEARLVLGCPSSGVEAARAHESLKAIHQGGTPDIDFAAPEPMFQRGWYLRSDVIWSKKANPMPESVSDRPTSAHEHVFLLAKNARYFYDAEAIRESATDVGRENGRDGRVENEGARPPGSNPRTLARLDYSALGRNKRNVWEIATQAYPDAHFATFPTRLVEPMVLASSSPGDVVLDPFAGSGTVGVVCEWLGRDFVGVELNPEYCEMARRRIEVEGRLGRAPYRPVQMDGQLEMFGGRRHD
jgi:DNA modification methylase